MLGPHGAIIGRSRPQEPEHSAPVRVEFEDARAGRMTVQRLYLAPSYASAAPGEADALDLLMRVAASGPVSRVYKRLVIEQKTAASAGGWYSDSGLDEGRVAFYAIGAEKVAPPELEQAIDRVIDELRDGGVTQGEIDRARSAYLAEFIYTQDSQSRMARHYGWRLATGMTVADVEAWPERLKQVTVESIRHVARKYLVDSNSVTGILVPASDQTSRSSEQPAHAPSPGRS
jgi:zinc protease